MRDPTGAGLEVAVVKGSHAVTHLSHLELGCAACRGDFQGAGRAVLTRRVGSWGEEGPPWCESGYVHTSAAVPKSLSLICSLEPHLSAQAPIALPLIPCPRLSNPAGQVGISWLWQSPTM